VGGHGFQPCRSIIAQLYGMAESHALPNAPS
jgi:hypothetical protein